MRYRTTILFLLACILGAYPALSSNEQHAACADATYTGETGALTLGSGDSSGCGIQNSSMERTLQVLAGFCALGGCLSAAKAWRDRQQDRGLLEGGRLPLFGRGVPYR